VSHEVQYYSYWLAKWPDTGLCQSLSAITHFLSMPLDHVCWSLVTRITYTALMETLNHSQSINRSLVLFDLCWPNSTAIPSCLIITWSYRNDLTYLLIYSQQVNSTSATIGHPVVEFMFTLTLVLSGISCYLYGEQNMLCSMSNTSIHAACWSNPMYFLIQSSSCVCHSQMSQSAIRSTSSNSYVIITNSKTDAGYRCNTCIVTGM